MLPVNKNIMRRYNDGLLVVKKLINKNNSIEKNINNKIIQIYTLRNIKNNKFN